MDSPELMLCDTEPRQHLLTKCRLGMIERQLKVGDSEHGQRVASEATVMTDLLRSQAVNAVFYSSHASVTYTVGALLPVAESLTTQCRSTMMAFCRPNCHSPSYPYRSCRDWRI